MNDTLDPAQYPRHYRIQMKMILTPVIGILLSLVAIAVTDPPLDAFFWSYAVVMLSLASIGSLMLASIGCTLYADRIEYIRPIRRTALLRTAIKGYRLKGWWRRVILVLEPIDPSQRPMRVNLNYLTLDAAWAGWMAEIPSLDAKPASPLPWSRPFKTFFAAWRSSRNSSEGK